MSERRYYSAADLRRELEAFEARYGLATSELVRLRQLDAVPEHVPVFEAFVWADLSREVERMASTSKRQETV